MKKYKLIKWYPSLPERLKVGDVVEFHGTAYYYPNSSQFEGLSPREVENSPQFWEPVAEKPYEILCFKRDGGYLIKKGKDGGWKLSGLKNFPTQYDKMIEDKRFHIHSVKRLSDGEIFTVGDKIDGVSVKNKEIREICFYGTDNIRFRYDNGAVVLHRAKNAEGRLFTADDGVDIFEGDEYWCAHNEDFDVESMQWKVNNTPYIAKGKSHYFYGNEKGKKEHNKIGNFYFSSRESAKEWIEQNKPRFSIRDIEEAIDKVCYNAVGVEACEDVLEHLKNNK